jgi:hypothetical protein
MPYQTDRIAGSEAGASVDMTAALRKRFNDDRSDLHA